MSDVAEAVLDSDGAYKSLNATLDEYVNHNVSGADHEAYDSAQVRAAAAQEVRTIWNRLHGEYVMVPRVS